MFRFTTALVASATLAPAASAAVLGLTNADFEDTGGSSDNGIQNIVGWFDFQGGNGDLQQRDTASANIPDDPDGFYWLNIVDSVNVADTGAYQSFGTSEAAEIAYAIQFNVAERADVDYNNLSVQLWYGSGGANGTSPSAAGLTLADEFELDFNQGVTGPAVGTASITLDATGIPNGETLWLAFASTNDDAAGGEQALIDDISVTAVIPEPASLALLGLGATLVLGRRRRR